MADDQIEKAERILRAGLTADRPSNLPANEGVKFLHPPVKTVSWTIRVRPDQVEAVRDLQARLQLQRQPRDMQSLTIEALDLLLEKYKDT
jgi:hypothetical protein